MGTLEMEFLFLDKNGKVLLFLFLQEKKACPARA